MSEPLALCGHPLRWQNESASLKAVVQNQSKYIESLKEDSGRKETEENLTVQLRDAWDERDQAQAKCAEMAKVLEIYASHDNWFQDHPDVWHDPYDTGDLGPPFRGWKRAEECLTKGNPGQPLLERLAWLESRNREQLDYSIALQRLVEHICHIVSIPEKIAKDCPHHAEMARKHLKWLEKLERVRKEVENLGREYLEDNYAALAEAVAACEEVKP